MQRNGTLRTGDSSVFNLLQKTFEEEAENSYSILRVLDGLHPRFRVIDSDALHRCDVGHLSFNRVLQMG